MTQAHVPPLSVPPSFYELSFCRDIRERRFLTYRLTTRAFFHPQCRKRALNKFYLWARCAITHTPNRFFAREAHAWMNGRWYNPLFNVSMNSGRREISRQHKFYIYASPINRVCAKEIANKKWSVYRSLESKTRPWIARSLLGLHPRAPRPANARPEGATLICAIPVGKHPGARAPLLRARARPARNQKARRRSAERYYIMRNIRTIPWGGSVNSERRRMADLSAL